MEKSVNLNTRIDESLKDRFLKVAKENDDTSSQLIRKWIKIYLTEHAQGSFKF